MGNRYVAFSVGQGKYAIPLDYVIQIVRYEKIVNVPKAPRFVEGVLNLRGDVIPIINMRERFGLSKIEPVKNMRIIVLRLETRTYGLLVDDVRELISIEDSTVQKDVTSVFGIQAEFISGIAKLSEGIIILPNLQRILTSADAISVAK